MIRMVADHIWQSTVFALTAGLFTLAFRRNRAGVRFWLWIAASVKFLIPFAVLLAAGRSLAPTQPIVSAPQIAQTANLLSQPFSRPDTFVKEFAPSGATSPVSSAVIVLVWITGFVIVLGIWWMRWRRVSAIVREGTSISDGAEVQMLRRLEAISGISAPVQLVRSQSLLEPGVFGFIRPALIWPDHISSCLTSEQIEAILAHEVCHVRRRDNLLAVVHMFVEGVFWFHPMVWWIGSRLIDERERACDEDVIALGSAPHVYARSILKTCELCVELPAVCASGVTGSDLKRRVARIVHGRPDEKLGVLRKLVLAASAMLTLAIPVGLGVCFAPDIHAQIPVLDPNGPRFEVVSIKPNKSGERGGGSKFEPGGYLGTNVTLLRVINLAYLPILHDQILGAPGWLETDHFDIAGKATGTPAPDHLQAMLRAMLADRFKLVVHKDTRELPVYTLVPARTNRQLGPQLRRSEVTCSSRDTSPGAPPQPLPKPEQGPACGFLVNDGVIRGQGITIAMLARELSLVGRVVLDRTGLDGRFDVDLKWTPDDGRASAISDVTIFTALQEQLGLKLESTKGPVDVLVIDGAARPTEN